MIAIVIKSSYVTAFCNLAVAVHCFIAWCLLEVCVLARLDSQAGSIKLNECKQTRYSPNGTIKPYITAVGLRPRWVKGY